MPRISITGPIGSGKTYTANKLQQALPNAVRGSFATAVKHIAALAREGDFEGVVDYIEPIHGQDLAIFFAHVLSKQIKDIPTEPVKDRFLLQYIGNDLGRNLNEFFWVYMEYALHPVSKDTIKIFDDVRYLNEADTMDLLIHISPSASYEVDGSYLGFDNHPSESGIPVRSNDLVIFSHYNNTTFNALVGHITERFTT